MSIHERLVGFEDPDVAAFLAAKLNLPGIPNTAQVLAFRDEIGVVGAWMFERYTGRGGSVYCHWAGRGGKWLKRYMLTMAAMYVFDQLGCEVCYGEVKSTDHEIRDLDERMGYQHVATLEGCFPDADLIIYQMKRADCAWLPEEFKVQTDG